MNNNEIQDKVITEATKTMEMFGLTTLDSRLFIYLYLEDQPYTLDEMSAALGKSKTSMSTSVRRLADLNLVSQVWRKGVRKDLYAANNHMFHTLVQSYSSRWIETTSRQREALEDIKQKMKSYGEIQSETKKPNAQLLNKLNDIIDFHHHLQTTWEQFSLQAKK